jgi:hypothetical protein
MGSADSTRARGPWAGSGYGPLPSLLLMLTVVTGVVDSVSYLAFGHVFVANMTGNVVFLGFALAGASGLSAPASLAAMGAFLLGALAGGRIATSSQEHRGRHLRRPAPSRSQRCCSQSCSRRSSANRCPKVLATR